MKARSTYLAGVSLLLLPACAPANRNALRSFAGTWSLTAFNERGDSLATSTLVAAGEPTGWTAAFIGREPLPVQVLSAGGDSVVLRSGPYPSVLQPGVQVTTENVLRVSGNRIIGTYVSRRTVTGPDSILRGTIRGGRQR
jgi:hypothetical protein